MRQVGPRLSRHVGTDRAPGKRVGRGRGPRAAAPRNTGGPPSPQLGYRTLQSGLEMHPKGTIRSRKLLPPPLGGRPSSSPAGPPVNRSTFAPAALLLSL